MLSAEKLIEERPELKPIIDAMLELARQGKPCLLIGKPGSGKTLVTRAVYSEVAKAWRPSQMTKCALFRRFVASGVLDYAKISQPSWRLEMPFRAPHHTVSKAGMEGTFCSKCGKGLVGEIMLANNGMLFLDEIDEFRAGVLDAIAPTLALGYAPPRGDVPQPAEPVTLQIVAASDSLKQCQKRLPEALMQRFAILNMPEPRYGRK